VAPQQQLGLWSHGWNRPGAVDRLDPVLDGQDITCRRTIMGKYVLGWILGVPVFVLVIVYLIFN
jgi:hypothetical protein